MLFTENSFIIFATLTGEHLRIPARVRREQENRKRKAEAKSCQSLDTTQEKITDSHFWIF